MRKTFVGVLLGLSSSLLAEPSGGARFFGGGEAHAQSAPATPAKDKAGQPAPQVVLPPQPSWAPSSIPEKHGDGRWSIRGVRKNEKTTLRQEVEVKGILVGVYECPPERKNCPKGQTCKPCEVPHFYVADTKDTPLEKSLIVCNYPVKPKPPTLPPVGTELVVKGIFTEEAGGFADSRGLLDHRKTTTAEGKVISTGNAVASKEDLIMETEAGKKGLPGKSRR